MHTYIVCVVDIYCVLSFLRLFLCWRLFMDIGLWFFFFGTLGMSLILRMHSSFSSTDSDWRGDDGDGMVMGWDVD